MPPQSAQWPKAVVFDLDGTLIDSVADITEALNQTMRAHRMAPFSLSEAKEMIGGGVPTLMAKALKAKDAPAHLDPHALADDFLKLYAANLTTHTHLYEGAAELLDALKAKGCKLAICTNKPHALAVEALRQLGLSHLFDVVRGEQEGKPKKPDPKPLHDVLGELDAKASEAVFVGDSIADVACAKAAGVTCVVVTFGYSRTPVQSLGADFVVDRLADVPACWGQELI